MLACMLLSSFTPVRKLKILFAGPVVGLAAGAPLVVKNAHGGLLRA